MSLSKKLSDKEWAQEMKIPFMITFLYFIMPIFHIVIFWFGLRYIPWPQEENSEGGNVR